MARIRMFDVSEDESRHQQPGERLSLYINRTLKDGKAAAVAYIWSAPMMAAAAWIAGHFTDSRNWKFD